MKLLSLKEVWAMRAKHQLQWLNSIPDLKTKKCQRLVVRGNKTISIVVTMGFRDSESKVHLFKIEHRFNVDGTYLGSYFEGIDPSAFTRQVLRLVRLSLPGLHSKVQHGHVIDKLSHSYYPAEFAKEIGICACPWGVKTVLLWQDLGFSTRYDVNDLYLPVKHGLLRHLGREDHGGLEYMMRKGAKYIRSLGKQGSIRVWRAVTAMDAARISPGLPFRVATMWLTVVSHRRNEESLPIWARFIFLHWEQNYRAILRRTKNAAGVHRSRDIDAVLNDLYDYLGAHYEETLPDAAFEALFQRSEAWHRVLRENRRAIDGVDYGPNLEKDTVLPWNGLEGTFSIGEFEFTRITTYGDLMDEGDIMRHCVATYVRYCLTGNTSIWSMRLKALKGKKLMRVATLEVAHAGMSELRQARTACNGSLNDQQRAATRAFVSWLNNQPLSVGERLRALNEVN